MTYPVNRTDFVLVDGVVSRVDIRIKDADRKPVPHTGSTLAFVVTKAVTGGVLLSASVEAVDATRGHFRASLDLTTGALPPGYYHYWVQVVAADGTARYLQTDLDRAMRGSFEVVAGPAPLGTATVTILEDDLIQRGKVFYSGAYRASAANSALFTANAYSGFLMVQASRREVPTTDDNQWTTIANTAVTLLTGDETVAFDPTGYRHVRVAAQANGITTGNVVTIRI